MSSKAKTTWPISHAVKKTETLATISQRYYTIPTLTDFIYQFADNATTHPNPTALTVGKILKVPELPSAWTELILTLKENGSNFQVFGGFQGIDQVNASTPYLLPPLLAPATFNTPITLRLGNLNTGSTPQDTIDTNPDFQFGWLTDPKLGIQAEITIKNENLWKADSKAQIALRTNFVTFMAAVEALELNAKTLIPSATALIAQTIVESLPTPLNLMSFYASGFNDGFSTDKNPYVDLRPGMRLRVETASNQFVAPGSPFNVPTATGQIIYNIVRVRGNLIAFDAFLGALNAPTINSNGQVRPAAGLIDLQAAGSARRYYRLFYPRQMLAANTFGDGKIEHSITLVGADNLAALNEATEAYVSRCEIVKTAQDGTSLSYVIFQGRVSATVEIGVYITHGVTTQAEPTPTFVPLGTTVRQVIDQFIPATNPLTLHTKPLIRFSRFHIGADGLPQHRTVVFRPDMNTEANYSVFDVPLAKGDRVEIRLADEKPSLLPN